MKDFGKLLQAVPRHLISPVLMLTLIIIIISFTFEQGSQLKTSENVTTSVTKNIYMYFKLLWQQDIINEFSEFNVTMA